MKAYHFLKRWGILSGAAVYGTLVFSLRLLKLSYGDDLHRLIVLFSILVCVLVMAQNTARLKNGQPIRDLPLFGTFFVKDEYSTGSGKARHIHTPLAKGLAFLHPQGICFGKLKTRYVCKPLKPGENLSLLIIGGSGSGKTSAAILPIIFSLKETDYGDANH